MPRPSPPPPRPPPPARRRPTPPDPGLLPALIGALGGACRIAVVGVGSDLRGDDAAGLLVARRLASWAARTGTRRLAAFTGGAAPENFTGEISRFQPDCVVLVDAAYLGRAPGEVGLIAPEQVGGLAFSTHMLPVPIFLDYLRATTGCRTVVVGIQVDRKDVLAPLTPAVGLGVRRLVSALCRAVDDGPPATAPTRRRGAP